MKIVKALIILLIILLGYFVITLKPTPMYKDTGYQSPCSFPNFHTAVWNGEEYRTTTDIKTTYLDELKKKFIESGISEDYFNKNIKLAFVNERGGTIDVFYSHKTNSWIDPTESGNGGYSIPVCKIDGTDCDTCRGSGRMIHAWINTRFGNGNTNITVYSIGEKTWHNDKVVSTNVGFKEADKIIGPWAASLKSRSCLLTTYRRYAVYLTPQLTYEYIVSGENLSTLFDPDYHMQARVDLVTGNVRCMKAVSRMY